MYLTYCDELGQKVAHVDEYGISCCDGYAHFDVNGTTHKIPISSIISICNA